MTPGGWLGRNEKEEKDIKEARKSETVKGTGTGEGRKK